MIAEFTETMSGKDVMSRPELKKAIALCKKEKAVLVVVKIDRLSRNTEDALSIYRELDGHLESCDIPNLDKFALTLFMAIADREQELIGIRTKAALEEKRKRISEWRKGSIPFKDTTAGAKGVEIIKEKAREDIRNKQAAKIIARCRKENMTLAQIAEESNHDGYRTRLGKLFKPMTVKRLFERASAL